MILGFLSVPSAWAFSFSHGRSLSAGSPPERADAFGVQTAPNVTLQNDPGSIKQIKNSFDHATYQDFALPHKEILFKIPSE